MWLHAFEDTGHQANTGSDNEDPEDKGAEPGISLCCCLGKLPGHGAGAGGAGEQCSIELICRTRVLKCRGEDRKNISTMTETSSFDENYKPTGPRSSPNPKHNSLKLVIRKSSK